jgi:hypothetical protein
LGANSGWANPNFAAPLITRTAKPYLRPIFVEILRQIPLYTKRQIRFGIVCTAAKGHRFGACCTSGDVVVNTETRGIFILKADLLAAGTRLRVGRDVQDMRQIEQLCLGDEVFDPVEDRLSEITEIACVTLDADTIRDRGFSPKLLAGDAIRPPLLYGVKVPTVLTRAGYVPPIRGEYALPEGTVFFALGFERRTIVETPLAFVEFMRPSLYAFETPLRRNATLPRDEVLTSLR